MAGERVNILVDTASAYGRGVIEGLAKYAHARARWVLGMYSYSAREELEGMLRNWSGAGIIAGITTERLLKPFSELPVPVVNVADQISIPHLPSVTSDNVAIGQMAAEHFLDRGFRHFAFMGIHADGLYADLRKQGFVETVEEAGQHCHVPAPEDLGPQENWSRGLSRWIESLPKPLAIMAPYDAIARLVITRCIQNDLSVPDEVAVIGVDNDEVVCQLSPVPISSVAVAAEQIGWEAARVLDDLINNRPASVRTTLISPSRVVTRQSTDVLVIDDPQVADAVRFIRNHADKLIQVQDVVNHVAVSRRVLERRFVEAIGRTPGEEIRLAHVAMARRLLVESDLAMPEVAAASGFTDATSLGRAFRQRLGITPSEYRRTHRMR